LIFHERKLAQAGVGGVIAIVFLSLLQVLAEAEGVVPSGAAGDTGARAYRFSVATST
jgi:hypothetical protein